MRMRETLTDEQVKEVENLLMKWKEVFSLHDVDLGLTGKVEHRIRLSENSIRDARTPRPG